jgi:hypothetical protein
MRLLTPPDRAGYSVDYGQETVHTQLDGGAGRYRLDIINASKKVTCQWILDQAQFTYFMAFYRTVTQRGALVFQINLIVDSEDLGEVNAHFVPNTVKLTGQAGLSFTVAGELEVLTPNNPTQEDDDMDIVSAYNTSQGYTPP